MKTLIISTVYPYPKDNGKKIILSSMVEYFISTYGKDNLEYIVLDKSTILDSTEFKVTQFEKPSTKEQILNLIKYSMFSKKKSIQESVLYSKKIEKKILDYITENEFDLIIYDTVRIAQYFENQEVSNAREIVYLDDLFSVRYEKMLQTMEENPGVTINALGNFSKFIPGIARNLLSVNIINKLLLKYERNLIAAREIEVANSFKECLLISEEETNILNKRTGLSNVKSIKPVLSYQPSRQREYKGSGNFIFLGNLNIPHNDVSIINFIEKNIGLMIKNNLSLDIIGKNPSEELKNLAQRYKKFIKLHGYVKDLDEMFSNSCGMVIPLIFGSGVKLKTLEAFSKGLPVITTNFGVEGIPLKGNHECIIENDVSKFGTQMLNLKDEKLNREISMNSLSFYKDCYAKEAVYKEYQQLL
ncbi:glycosyltransferase family 4 protein [Bacillus sp. LS15-K4]|nr:glycosyltransferase family 4 protein [Bacillus sp. LS15-K4]MDJ1474765.1 glycosyltransferase family 4 protein [Bacillus sp. LS15-K4]